MNGLKKFLSFLVLLPLGLSQLCPQSYCITEEQLTALEMESEGQKKQISALKTQLTELRTQLETLNRQLKVSEENLKMSKVELEISRQALEEADQSLQTFENSVLRNKILTAVVAFGVGVAGGLLVGFAAR